MERKVTAAIRAADRLATAAEYDLAHLIRDENRNFLGATSEKGGTVRAGHTALKADVEKVVAELGEVKGKLAEAAQQVRELARLGSAEMEMVLGLDPIDDDFVSKSAEYRGRVAQVREKLKPLLPADAESTDPPPSNTY